MTVGLATFRRVDVEKPHINALVADQDDQAVAVDDVNDATGLHIGGEAGARPG